MSDLYNTYYKKYPITKPAYAVARIGGSRIRDKASKLFSGRLIDIGCGLKTKEQLVGDFVDEYVGLDHVECQYNQSNIDLFGTAYNIPSENETFDCALCTAVLEHLEEPKKALKETYRVLKSGGCAIYTVPLFWHLHEEPRDFFRYTKNGLKYLFEAAGFEIIEITALSGFLVTFGTELGYYLQRFKRGPFRHLINGIVIFSNWFFPILDRGFLRDEKFTWMYLVVALKPAKSKK